MTLCYYSVASDLQHRAVSPASVNHYWLADGRWCPGRHIYTHYAHTHTCENSSKRTKQWMMSLVKFNQSDCLSFILCSADFDAAPLIWPKFQSSCLIMCQSFLVLPKQSWPVDSWISDIRILLSATKISTAHSLPPQKCKVASHSPWMHVRRDWDVGKLKAKPTSRILCHVPQTVARTVAACCECVYLAYSTVY